MVEEGRRLTLSVVVSILTRITNRYVKGLVCTQISSCPNNALLGNKSQVGHNTQLVMTH